MAESNATQVILTDDGIKIIKAQNTADNAAGGVANLNDPNLMNVIEKQNNIVQFAGLTSQYNVLVQNAKDEGIDTTAATTAYNNLNIFMADILADPDHASDVDRARYKKYQDVYNEELAKLQNALQNNTNDKFTSAANATSQAASTASQAFSAANGAFSQAQLIGSQADSAIAVQSQATAKAQSTADNAFSQAQVIGSQASADISINSMATAKAQSTADNAFSQAQTVGSQASAEIATQSEATIKAQSTADSAFSEAQKVGEQTSAEIAKQSEAITGAQSKANSALAKAEEVDGKTSAEIAKQSAATAKAQSTADSAFKEAQSATAYTDKQIASQASAVSEVSKTATEASSKANSALDTANGANAEIVKLKGGSTATIAKLEDGLGTKVSNDTFDSYQTQTASQFAQTVKEADFKTYQTQTSKLIESKVDNGTYQTDKTQTAGAIASKVSSGEFKTYQTQTDKALSSKVSSSDYESDREQTASQIADKVSNGEFSTYKTQTDKLIGSKVDNGDFKTYQTQTDKLINSKVDNGTYQSDKTQTANQIASKVSSTDFNSYKSQTDKAIESKVSSADFNNLKISNRNLALGTATALITTGNNTANQSGSIYKTSKTIPKGTTVTTSFDISSTSTTGTFTVHFYGANDGNWQTVTVNAQNPLTIDVKHYSYTFVTTEDHSDGIQLRLDNVTGTVTMSNFIISESSKEVNWTPAPEDQATQSQITQLSGQIDQKVSSGDFNSYKTQTDKLIGQKVDNGAFKTYQNQTDKLIESKVDNGTYQSDKTQTASQIASKVSSTDFNSYKSQTDKLIESKVDNGTYQSDKTQTANQISDKVSNGAFNTYKTQTDKLIAEKVSNGDFNTYKSQTADLISQKVATKDFSAYQATTAKAIESKVESSDFNTYKQQTDKAITSKVESKDFQTLQKQVDNSAVGTNLAIGTNQEYAMGYGIPHTSWTDGYAYLKLPTNVTNGEILPQDPHTFYYTLTQGTTYTQTIWFETDATVKDLNAVQVTWFTGGAGHDVQPAMIQKLGQNSYKVVSTYTWPGKSDNSVRLFDIEHLDSAFDLRTGTYLKFGKLKLEQGSLSTDWCLNPAETATKSQITQLSGQIDQKVSSGDFNSYKTQTDKLIAEKVSNGDFTTYKSQTADLISAKVSTKDFSSYQDTTAKAISSKVESGDFNTYKTQTAGLISSKVDSGDFSTYKTQTDKLIEAKVDNGTYQSDKTQTANDIASKVANKDFETYKSQTADLISSKVATKDFNTYTSQTATAINSKVASSDFNTYKTQTANLISSKVASSDFNTYKTQTAGMISSKVESSNFQALQAQVNNSAVGTNLLMGTATPVSIKGTNSSNQCVYTYALVGGMSAYALYQKYGSTFTLSYDWSIKDTANNYTGNMQQQFNQMPWGVGDNTVISGSNKSGHKVTTFTLANNSANEATALEFRLDNVPTTSTITVSNMKLEKGKVSTDWCRNPEEQATQSQITQLSNDINLRVTKNGLLDQINLSAGKTLISSSGQLTLSGKSVFLDSSDPVIMKSANIDRLLVGKQLTAADISANTFTTNNGTFTVDKNGLVTATSLIVRGSTNLVYNAALLGSDWFSVPGWSLTNQGFCGLNITHDGVKSIGFNNTAVGWTLFAQTKLYPLNGVTGQPFSASVWFLEFGSDTSLRYQFTLAFFDSNGNRVDGYVGNTWSGIGSKQEWRYVTIDNAVAPSNAVSVGLQYWAYNGHGNAYFSSPMLTQTTKATGYQPDTGNVVSAGIITGTVINGSTINGATFHGGDVINNQHNTSHFYPMTIESNGTYKTTFYDQMVGLQSIIESGGLQHKFRSMVADSNGHFVASNAALDGQGFHSQSGYTSAKDSTFSSPQTITGYVDVTPASGIYLYGPTQKINFAGNKDNIGSDGITMDSYGNMYGQPNSLYWRIGDANAKAVADFGFDTANKRDILLYRNVSVGNLFLGVGHTIGMLDKKPLYFKQGTSSGNMLDIKAGTVYYTGLTKSSLLSVKRDVKKADTAYWAQLVNSIDLATYQYKSDDNTSHIRLSSIVDDVNDTKQWRLPDIFISRDEDGKLSGVDDSVLLNAILATVQEQQKEIDQLNGHNMELEARLNKLEAKLNE